MKALPRTIGFLLTYKCNAECRMCCFECGPHRDESFPTKDMLEIIDQAHEYKESGSGTLGTIGFSGGEAFLRFDDVLEVSRRAHNYGFRVVCTSNGFWGTNAKRAEEYVEEFHEAGLSKLSLSFDRFHNEYIPVENIKNIIEAAKKYSVEIEIGSIVTHSTSDLGNMFSALSESLINVRHVVAPCLPVGAAAKNLDADDYIIDEYLLTRDTHCTDLNTIAIYPGGDVFPCCSQLGMMEAMKLGNIYQSTLDDIMKSYNSNMLIRIINKFGLTWFVDKAKEIGYRDFYSEPLINRCDLCFKILSDPNLIELLQPYIESYKHEIFQKYLDSKR